MSDTPSVPPTTPEGPQIYLVSPADFDPAEFAPRLAAMLDAVPVACVRLALDSRSEDRLLRAADALREVCHARDVPLVIDRHVELARRAGLDGVHLPDGAGAVRKARAALGAEAIVGAFCGASRHAGLAAGEAGADYIAFGPVAGGALGTGDLAQDELFAWWSEVIELPVVAEGALDPRRIGEIAAMVDFFALGEEVWTAPDPVAALKQLRAAIG
ncbi:MAG: thiamine phosphate synthase [Alkalilacustris sp.]